MQLPITDEIDCREIEAGFALHAFPERGRDSFQKLRSPVHRHQVIADVVLLDLHGRDEQRCPMRSFSDPTSRIVCSLEPSPLAEREVIVHFSGNRKSKALVHMDTYMTYRPLASKLSYCRGPTHLTPMLQELVTLPLAQ